jgi:hypothetical protein
MADFNYRGKDQTELNRSFPTSIFVASIALQATLFAKCVFVREA